MLRELWLAAINGELETAKKMIDPSLQSDWEINLALQPDKEEGLVAIVCDGEVPAKMGEPYVAAYDVNCAFCKKRTPHKNGFFAILQDGRKALCGKDCAEEFFGKDVVRKAEAKRTRAVARAKDESIRQAILEGVPQALEKAVSLEDTLWKYRLSIESLRSLLPSTLLMSHQPDTAGGITVLIYRLEGYAALKEGPPIGKTARGLQNLVEKTKIAIMSDANVERFLNQKRRLLDLYDAQQVWLELAKSLLEEDNLTVLRHWLRSTRHKQPFFDARLEDGHLVLTSGDEKNKLQQYENYVTLPGRQRLDEQ